jgi:hypothetical protein
VWERAAAIIDAAPPIALIHDHLRANHIPPAAWIAPGDLDAIDLPTLTFVPITVPLKLRFVPILHSHPHHDAIWCFIDETLGQERGALPCLNCLMCSVVLNQSRPSFS